MTGGKKQAQIKHVRGETIGVTGQSTKRKTGPRNIFAEMRSLVRNNIDDPTSLMLMTRAWLK